MSDHPGFTLNKSGTRIRCHGTGCLEVLDLEGTAEETFAKHLAARERPAPLAVETPAPAPLAATEAPASEDDAGDLFDEAAESLPENPAPEAAPGVEHPPETAEVPAEPADPAGAPGDPAPVPAPKKRTSPKTTPAAALPKRNVKEVTEALATVKAGDRVSATFRQPRYGDFTIEATVVSGLTHRALVVGAWHLGVAGKPSRQLQSLVRLASKGKHDMAIPVVDDTEHHGMTS